MLAHPRYFGEDDKGFARLEVPGEGHAGNGCNRPGQQGRLNLGCRFQVAPHARVGRFEFGVPLTEPHHHVQQNQVKAMFGEQH